MRGILLNLSKSGQINSQRRIIKSNNAQEEQFPIVELLVCPPVLLPCSSEIRDLGWKKSRNKQQSGLKARNFLVH